MYEIVDRHSDKVVGTAKSLREQAGQVDRRDNAYGAYRYFHRKAAADDRQLQVVEVEAVDARAKALIDYQNAMFAAAYCRRDNGRCEGCGE